MPTDKLAGKTREQLLQSLETNGQGLTTDEARQRQQHYGGNQIHFHRARSPWLMLAAEFTALFPLLLLVASALSLFAHNLSPGQGYELIAVALLLVVILNASVSFIQSYRVEKLMISFLDYIPKKVVPNWACLSIWSTAIPSPGRGWACASSGR